MGKINETERKAQMKQKLPSTIGVFSNFGGSKTSSQSRSTKDGGEKDEYRRN
jgi:hypothetical protein